jgi:3-oxoacyl-[acyl-carrier-protein] synthase III
MIKKATDTNHFVSEQADKALAVIVNACTDTKVFACLQATPGRSNGIKQKITLCYGNLINKLGNKFKIFKDGDRLIKAVVGMLSESAQEVRNQAKLAILGLKNCLDN